MSTYIPCVMSHVVEAKLPNLSMMRRTLMRLATVVAIVAGLANSPSARVNGDDFVVDPVALKMAEKGAAFLEKNYKEKTQFGFTSLHDPGFGEHAILGYAHLKVMHDPTNPVVQQGIRSSLAMIQVLNRRAEKPGKHEGRAVYAISIVAMLLSEIDSVKYRKELNQAADFLKQVQASHGGFTYPYEEMGDVSQTQYAILALWTMDQKGVLVNYPGVNKTIDWLTRVQDPSGGWPYLGVDPGRGSRVKQQRVTGSMAVAGGSAILIASDILRAWASPDDSVAMVMASMPESVKLYEEGQENLLATRPEVDSAMVLRSVNELDAWIAKNSISAAESQFPNYQTYTTERYYSFRDIALKAKPDPKPAWFIQGMSFLQGRQGADGSWPEEIATSRNVATAFGMLFLVRSTLQAIQKVDSGTTAGGWGFPKNTTEIVVDGTQIKGKEVSAAVDGLLDVLEGNPDEGLEGKSIPEDLELATDPKTRSAQIDRLERLLRGSQSWQARRVAARLLGQSDEHRVVPVLIYALSDPDSMVKIYARDGLRFISRKFEGFAMPSKPTDPEIRKAQNQWRDWYRSTNPGYQFLDYDF